MIHKEFLQARALLPPITILARQLSPAANPGGHSPREVRTKKDAWISLGRENRKDLLSKLGPRIQWGFGVMESCGSGLGRLGAGDDLGVGQRIGRNLVPGNCKDGCS